MLPLIAMGPRIKKSRIEAGYTMESLAEALDISKQSVKLWENGSRRPSLDNLKVLSKLLGKPQSWFLGQEVACEEEVPYQAHADATNSKSHRNILQMIARQQDLLAEQQAMLAQQQKDVSRLTEILAKQQEASLG